ncbi:carboxylating nicotinate-nucleotide diphosphorylase [Nakamurella multipartita]|jgi:nicotinate-nucleotide pyrophosphorylase (carboxylating)|uniref:Nicotinate-nucleotide pyrophosphorylase [carboxylating] n=1 Tax=Nakamurella multipartita (strain ATCC 700099 / DSM 44233 / CIP 104796 / JCM 9543 / NBRC 105858 / Y-104) TaxID=479431 RepID=C8XBZ3_NAKMY|nr:carboxylating nicotinate-nucleotide diphosphorylase [Nakamurella multipartita]ACV79497.1 nicotinate-nucleotide pyrophosphorylase [Nakamurella multipartita DSM 44233]
MIDAVSDQAVIDRALAEDLADGADVTTLATVPADQSVRAQLTPRQAGVLAGGPIAAQVFRTVIGSAVRVEQLVPDGGTLVPGEPALIVHGPTAGILTAERTALNLLTHLSGIASATRTWVDAVAGTGARIRDTRKTLPGLRALEKYAVRCGGGVNHRMSLGDAALIKDNHVAAAGSVTAAIKAVRALDPDITLEVEVDTLEQFDEAIGAGAELVLLDNFSLADTAEAVLRARALPRRVYLEASGGLTLDRARAVARTGVDYLAVGALTHSAPALDLGLDLVG